MIRLIDDTIEMMNSTNKPGILLAVDYKRAFDSISKDFIIWAFKRFGFGDYFVRWIFPVNSGIRQGCPFSPLAFIVALELLAIKIRNEPSIKGIELPISFSAVEISTVLKILLYADDITIFLQDKNDLEKLLELLNSFAMFSNLEINKNKTEAMWLGSKKDADETYFDIKWKNKVKIVGIVFSSFTPASLIEDNWLNRLEKVQRLIASWSKRNLSISGKLCIIKTFLLSQFIYVMQALALLDGVLT
jgi:hypothetical protein